MEIETSADNYSMNYFAYYRTYSMFIWALVQTAKADGIAACFQQSMDQAPCSHNTIIKLIPQLTAHWLFCSAPSMLSRLVRQRNHLFLYTVRHQSKQFTAAVLIIVEVKALDGATHTDNIHHCTTNCHDQYSMTFL